MNKTEGPSQIQKYNNMMGQARDNEQGKHWKHAAKMWRECERLAQDNFWREKAEWCRIRSEFCENAAARRW